MPGKKSQAVGDVAVEQVLGYLNFSSGPADAQFLANLNRLFEHAVSEAGSATAWLALGRLLADHLATKRESAAFRDADQADAVLELVFDQALPASRKFHRDLLFHRSDESLFRPFFIGRVCEAVLRQGPPWDERERIVGEAINQLNDYVGHRPIAALETQKPEADKHEFARPIPIFIRVAG